MIQAKLAQQKYLDKWNFLDISGLILFLVGFILRMIGLVNCPECNCPECLYSARIIFAFSLMVFILRSLQLLSIDTRLGPKIYMMDRLVCAFVVFIF